MSRQAASGDRGYSYDTVWNLLDAANQLVQRAHALCDDDDTEWLDTALCIAAGDAIQEAKRARFQALRGAVGRRSA